MAANDQVNSGDTSISSTSNSLKSWVSGLASTLGGDRDRVGSRITPIRARSDPESSANKPEQNHLPSEDDGGDIEYRSCSWIKTTKLMMAMYIGMAILGLPYAFSTMGYVPALISAALIAASVQYTGMILWQVCIRHPEARDICDVGRIVLGGSHWAWILTTIIFLLNNIAVMGLHIVVGGQYLNTVTKTMDIAVCRTVLFCAVIAISCFVCSLVRTLRMLSFFAIVSSVCTFASVLTIIFCLVGQKTPANYRDHWYVDIHGVAQPGGEPLFSPWPPEGTTWIQFMVAFLVMAYAFIGHTALPSFIYEMEDPRDFPKALWTTTLAVLTLFIIVGTTISGLNGSQYMTAPAFGGLTELPKIITFSLMLPTTVILGAMYASITGRFVFFRVFRGSRHINNHTITGWASWAGIMAILWILAFLVSQLVPFFSSLLAVIGAIFDAFFGYIYWAIAWLRMRQVDARDGYRARGPRRDRFEIVVNFLMLAVGVGLFLVAGSVASVMDIMKEFREGSARGVFSCESNAL